MTDGKTLMAMMTYPGYDAPLPLARYEQLAPRWDEAMLQAQCTTVDRVAMAAAQLGAESGSLRWAEELADGSAYEGRRDLGNVLPGDGPRFKGRSFIQITGRAHYANLSRWAHQHGYVRTDRFFLDHPTALADDEYVFLGFVWYWTVARPGLNGMADARDINGATYAVNGGYNNLSGRTARWRKCLTLGEAMMPRRETNPERQGVMYELLRDSGSGNWYAWAAGYWYKVTSAEQLAQLACSPLCVNGAAVRRKQIKRYQVSHTHILMRRQAALGSAVK